jgi:hypothetical protein
LKTLAYIRKELPEAESLILRLRDLLARSSGTGHEYTIQHLYEVLKPKSLTQLSLVLGMLIERNLIDRIVRVTAASGAGLKDFSSFSEVPDRIFDGVDTGFEIPVTDENVQVIYRMH